ncbi:Nif3-like dinuclear metal center hexameric protein [Kitasatospora sp. NBC_00240]|uniref:Nif3-like dinuclear metal center hexameric protein n=1 Tax=Kitasatospora sp. NBC_00240 TaxID=2903567 RepID=UPI00224CA695|nr:Nif3-like dinuclear metal center hexameric protein [Kitasatospora sp. NBC_00240]MCX5213223.1 Nif3-like dinuclear metal center hexameric protein [Kitasatospora sp. NBC_00240]
MPNLSEVISALEELYPPRWAESWDAVGLVCGDPEARVGRVLFAVDPVQAVVDEAVEWGADLVVTHHPLYLRGTTSVAATGFKGRVVHTLISSGIALHVAHTNADHAAPGVSDALAEAVGLRVTGPLVPDPTDPAGLRGSGRIGLLEPPLTLSAFAAQVAQGLPATATGVRVSGDPDRLISRVAVCGGAGDSFLADARAAGVDAYLTSDLRHHPASEAAQSAPVALVDAAHWATEWPWLNLAARSLAAASDKHDWQLETKVSHRVTDPWTAHAPMPYTA